MFKYGSNKLLPLVVKISLAKFLKLSSKLALKGGGDVWLIEGACHLKAGATDSQTCRDFLDILFIDSSN